MRKRGRTVGLARHLGAGRLQPAHGGGYGGVELELAVHREVQVQRLQLIELRRGKMTAEQCRAALQQGNYFGTMLVAMGEADCLLGGATYSTADTVRPAR